jgi:hypothetical protein
MRDMETPRLFEADDAPAPLQDLLGRAQQDVPTPDEAARLVRSVEAEMAATGAAGKPVTRRPWLPREGRVPGKLIVAVVLAGLGTVGYFVVQRHVSAPATSIAPSPTAPTPVVPAPQPTMEALAPSPAVQEQATPVKARDAVRSRGKHREAVRHPTPPESPSTEGVSSDEFALLRAARQAVAAQPERALSLTEEHAQRFPKGMLAQEREAIAIEALAKLGRATQAQARAQTFLKAHPGSPYRPRIDAALARLSGSRPSP